MSNEELIALECPYCHSELYRPLAWFRQAFFTCPACDGGLAAGQFAAIVEELDTAIEAHVAEMLQGQPEQHVQSGCGCGCGHREG